MGLTAVIGCHRGIYALGQGHFNPKPTVAQFLTTRRCFRLSRQQLHASPHYLQKYSPWSTKFTGSLDSKIFWQSAVYAAMFFGVTSYFCVSASSLTTYVLMLVFRLHQTSVQRSSYCFPFKFIVCIPKRSWSSYRRTSTCLS